MAIASMTSSTRDTLIGLWRMCSILHQNPHVVFCGNLQGRHIRESGPKSARLLTPTITLPWTPPSFAAVKGIIHAPCAKLTMKAETREALLTAIAKARGWIDDIRLGRIASFAEIAEREAQGWLPSPSSRPASLRRSSMAPRLRTLWSPASPRPLSLS